MNGFRVTILVLLSLTVGVMFYAFVVLLPARQNQYEMYQTQQKINEYEKRQQEHEARMAGMAADAETPEVAAARAAAEQESRKNEADLTAAEESSVIASVKRRQEIEQAAAAVEEATAHNTTVGSVTAYLQDCAVILFKASGNTPVHEGLQIALQRNDYIVCEATVDGRDKESGQYTATLKQVSFGGVQDPAVEANRVPRVGDRVIVSPFLSGSELRASSYEAQLPAQDSTRMPEIEAVLTPVP